MLFCMSVSYAWVDPARMILHTTAALHCENRLDFCQMSQKELFFSALCLVLGIILCRRLQNVFCSVIFVLAPFPKCILKEKAISVNKYHVQASNQQCVSKSLNTL